MYMVLQALQSALPSVAPWLVLHWPIRSMLVKGLLLVKFRQFAPSTDERRNSFARNVTNTVITQYVEKQQ